MSWCVVSRRRRGHQDDRGRRVAHESATPLAGKAVIACHRSCSSVFGSLRPGIGHTLHPLSPPESRFAVSQGFTTACGHFSCSTLRHAFNSRQPCLSSRDPVVWRPTFLRDLSRPSHAFVCAHANDKGTRQPTCVAKPCHSHNPHFKIEFDPTKKKRRRGFCIDTTSPCTLLLRSAAKNNIGVPTFSPPHLHSAFSLATNATSRQPWPSTTTFQPFECHPPRETSLCSY